MCQELSSAKGHPASDTEMLHPDAGCLDSASSAPCASYSLAPHLVASGASGDPSQYCVPSGHMQPSNPASYASWLQPQHHRISEFTTTPESPSCLWGGEKGVFLGKDRLVSACARWESQPTLNHKFALNLMTQRCIFRTSSLNERKCQLTPVWMRVIACGVSILAQLIVVSRHLASKATWYTDHNTQHPHSPAPAPRLHHNYLIHPSSDTGRLLNSRPAIHWYPIHFYCTIIHQVRRLAIPELDGWFLHNHCSDPECEWRDLLGPTPATQRYRIHPPAICIQEVSWLNRARWLIPLQPLLRSWIWLREILEPDARLWTV